jgi:hypothetical protein
MIKSDTDAFFCERDWRHEPVLFRKLSEALFFGARSHMSAVSALYSATDNVVVNNPAQRTGPRAIKNGMIAFQRPINITNNGCVPNGTYMSVDWATNSRPGCHGTAATATAAATKTRNIQRRPDSRIEVSPYLATNLRPSNVFTSIEVG